jgi:hypothetical protein
MLDGPPPWELPVSGFEVLTITFRSELHVVAYGDRGESISIGLGGSFRFRDAAGREAHLDGEGPWAQLTPVLDLRHVRIAQATADAETHLRVEFDGGQALEAGPDPAYENWRTMGPGDVELIAPPGGGDPRFHASAGSVYYGRKRSTSD